ncbi:MAG TPA: LCP family protein [Solirubrobacterales bacterium]|jgi:LCP family protein required for cell wall assembly|nr:LCP family protein [Solirubrobacterales bacterium]
MTEPIGGWSPKKPPPSGDHEPAPKPKRYWLRFTLASLFIVAVSAAATTTAVLLYLDSIAHALSHNNVYANKLERVLAKVDGGEPQNILILGSDKRADMEEDPGRSDTTMLLRLDPDRNAIAVMSIPRDLKTEIPGYGTGKFNEAYSYGGPKLTLQTVKEMTGLQINHVVNVDFLGFVRAVYAIGCVYVDVDRRYFHSNVGVSESEQYAEINVQPGYQLLCGKKALQYVRYRHTDTDLVRAARQQDFISAARQRISVQDLVFDQSGLIDIFTKYTTSDINDKETMLEVMKLFLAARNAAIKEVHFPAELGPSFVYASQSAIDGAVEQFLGIEASGGPRGSLEDGEATGGAEAKGKSKGKQTKAKKPKKKKPLVKPKPPGSDGLVAAGEAGELEGKTAARKVSSGFPVFYPSRLPSGAGYVESNSYLHIQDPRIYHVKDGDDHRHGAYRMVLSMDMPDGTHYFGMQGVQGWEDPPILNNPSETRTIHGREYDIYVDGDRVKLIAWHRGDNSYWISNSLLQVLTNDQMVGMARSAKVIIPNKKPRQGGKKR